MKYAKVYSGLKGTGFFDLYLGKFLVKRMEFDESIPLADFDFSKDLNTLYKNNTPDGQIDLSLDISKYTYNSANDGFKISFMFEASYKNRLPPSSDDAPLSFQLSYNEQLDTLKTLGGI